ncbi:MAG: hypothetical protein LBD68_06155 [Zoogloeaceae bacterium]|jgi:hypothetical protein|nr:hypothetical protein [Zoogloeaceae bacterium]
MAFTTNDLVVIERAIAAGELTVRFADRTITYRSMSELLRARELILADLAAQRPRRARVTRLYQAGKGFSGSLPPRPSVGGGVAPCPCPPEEDDSAIIFRRVAGVALSALKAVWEDEDGKVWPLDCRDAAHVDFFVGITLTAAQAGGDITLQSDGELDASGLNLAPGPVWLGENGALTQIPPEASGTVDLYLGAATAGSRLMLSPAEPIFLE